MLLRICKWGGGFLLPPVEAGPGIDSDCGRLIGAGPATAGQRAPR